MRIWNIRELTKQEEELMDIWLSILDNEEKCHSTRILLLEAVDGLFVSLEESDYGEFRQNICNINKIIKDSPIEYLNDIIEDLEDVLDEFEEVENDRRTLKDAFQETIEFNTGPIFDGLDNWWIDHETVNELRSRLYSQATSQADKRLFKDITEASIVNELNNVRSHLASEVTVTGYTTELVGIIEKNLNSIKSISDNYLRKVIQELFAELRSRGWREDDFQKVLRKYVTNDNGESSKVQFFEKIGEKSSPKLCHVGLPDAHMGDFTPLEVGEVTFHSLSDPDFDIQSRQHPATVGINFANQAEVWASAEVVGATEDIMMRHLKEKVARAVDVLNLGKKAGTLSPPFDESYTILQETSDNRVLPLKRSRDLSKVPFSQIASKSDIKSRIEHFSDYLDGAIETPLEVALSNSIRWYGYANRSPEDEEQFLKYIISIESLLVEGKAESKRDTIAERAVNILQMHEGVRPEQEELFTSMYEIRNEIVHSGARNLPAFEHQLSKLEQRASHLISIVEQYTDECDSISEVVRQIHNEEAELKEERIEDSPFEVGESFNIEASLITGGGSDLALVQLNGQFIDDGRYVYYEADIEGGEFHSGIGLNSDMRFKVKFEVGDTSYTGIDVVFPEEDILEVFPTNLPDVIRWYQVKDQDIE